MQNTWRISWSLGSPEMRDEDQGLGMGAGPLCFIRSGWKAQYIKGCIALILYLILLIIYETRTEYLLNQQQILFLLMSIAALHSVVLT